MRLLRVEKQAALPVWPRVQRKQVDRKVPLGQHAMHAVWPLSGWNWLAGHLHQSTATARWWGECPQGAHLRASRQAAAQAAGTPAVCQPLTGGTSPSPRHWRTARWGTALASCTHSTAGGSQSQKDLMNDTVQAGKHAQAAAEPPHARHSTPNSRVAHGGHKAACRRLDTLPLSSLAVEGAHGAANQGGQGGRHGQGLAAN